MLHLSLVQMPNRCSLVNMAAPALPLPASSARSDRGQPCTIADPRHDHEAIAMGLPHGQLDHQGMPPIPATAILEPCAMCRLACDDIGNASKKTKLPLSTLESRPLLLAICAPSQPSRVVISDCCALNAVVIAPLAKPNFSGRYRAANLR